MATVSRVLGCGAGPAAPPSTACTLWLCSVACSPVVSWACTGQITELWPKMGCTTASLTVPKPALTPMDFSSCGKASFSATISFERGAQYYAQHVEYSHPTVNGVACVYNNIFHPLVSQPLLLQIQLFRNRDAARGGG